MPRFRDDLLLHHRLSQMTMVQMPDSQIATVSDIVDAIARGDVRAATAAGAEIAAAKSMGFLVRQLRERFDGSDNYPVLWHLGQILSGRQTRLQRLSDHWTFSEVSKTYIVGSSFVRAFGLSSDLLPMFIGKAINANVGNDEAFASMRSKYEAVFCRIKPGSQIVLPIGIDASLLMYPQGKYLVKTGPALSKLSPEERFEVLSPQVEDAARRYRELVERALQISPKVFVVLAPPTLDHHGSRLTKLLNDRIQADVAALGVAVIDIWGEFISPATGLLDVERFGLPTILDNYHYNQSGAALILQTAQRAGLELRLDGPKNGFTWTHVFTFEAGLDEPIRIWCEPEVSAHNALTSQKIAATFVADHLATVVTGHCLSTRYDAIRWHNDREAYLPLRIPPEMVGRHMVHQRSGADPGLAAALVDFVRRPDIVIHGMPRGDGGHLPQGGKILDCCVIHPEDEGDGLGQILDTLKEFPIDEMLVLARPGATSHVQASLGFTARQHWKAGVTHLQADWRDFAVTLLRR